MDWITIPDNQDQAPAEYTSKWGQAKKVTFCTQRAFCRQPPSTANPHTFQRADDGRRRSSRLLGQVGTSAELYYPGGQSPHVQMRE